MMKVPRLSKTKVLALLIGVAAIRWIDYWLPPSSDERLWKTFVRIFLNIPFEFASVSPSEARPGIQSFRVFQDYHANSRGYKSEAHKIWTSDGYEIEFHRLWNPNVTGQDQSNPVVFGPMCFFTSKLQIFQDNAPRKFDGSSREAATSSSNT